MKYKIDRISFLIGFLCVFAIAGTTNVRIYQQSQSNLSLLQSKQVGVNTSSDADLGYKMWGAKDADGNVTQWLAKDKNGRVLKLWSDSVYSKRDTSKLMKADSGNFTSIKNTRITSDSIYTRTMKMTGSLTGLSKVSADTVAAVKYVEFESTNIYPTHDGSMWYEEAHGALHTVADSVVGSMNRTLFVQGVNVLDSNSTVETSLVGAGYVHQLDSFPINYFRKGKTHEWIMSGVYSTKTTGPGNMIIKISMNNVPLCSATVTLDANEIDQQWRMAGYVTCGDTGVNGKMKLTTGFEHTIAGVQHNDRLATPDNGTTVNTNIRQMPKITVRFTLADVQNKIKTNQFIIKELH